MPTSILALIALLVSVGVADDILLLRNDPVAPRSDVQELQMSEQRPVGPALLDGQWRISEIDGNLLPEMAKISLVINGSKVTGHSTCNRFVTTVEHAGTQVLFGGLPKMRKTCGPEFTRIEAAFIRAFRRVDRVELHQDGTLGFHGGPVLLMRAGPLE